MKILITGISGFVGSHLTDFVLEHFPHIEIHGLIRRRSDIKNIQHRLSSIVLHECDLTDSHSVDAVFRSQSFEKCFHLAGQSHVPTSWIRPIETMNVNANGTMNLLESIRHHNKNCHVLICGSSEEYGLVYEHEVPITEDNPLRPLSPYAVSKVAADFIGHVYFKSYGLHVVRSRAFNHEGVRRPEDFVLAKITKQAVEIQLGRRTCFELGNTDATRDITDVRDIVHAYWLLLEKGEPGEAYNISSGKTYSIQELVEMTAKQAGIPSQIEQNPKFLRPADVPRLLGDCTKMKQLTGWKRRYEIPDTIHDMIENWRSVLTSSLDRSPFVETQAE
ncbi:MAG: GDP-mannose 4,6-dehydratase [Candidatus Omnitrophica bacterium]|nr:GDP-mannose 4,6-dehydratase [Candidatus Omnitrophota bacterium]